MNLYSAINTTPQVWRTAAIKYLIRETRFPSPKVDLHFYVENLTTEVTIEIWLDPKDEATSFKVTIPLPTTSVKMNRIINDELKILQLLGVF